MWQRILASEFIYFIFSFFRTTSIQIENDENRFIDKVDKKRRRRRKIFHYSYTLYTMNSLSLLIDQSTQSIKLKLDDEHEEHVHHQSNWINPKWKFNIVISVLKTAWKLKNFTVNAS